MEYKEDPAIEKLMPKARLRHSEKVEKKEAAKANAEAKRFSGRIKQHRPRDQTEMIVRYVEQGMPELNDHPIVKNLGTPDLSPVGYQINKTAEERVKKADSKADSSSPMRLLHPDYGLIEIGDHAGPTRSYWWEAQLAKEARVKLYESNPNSKIWFEGGGGEGGGGETEA